MLSRNLTSQAWVDHIRSRIDDTRTYQVMIMMIRAVNDPSVFTITETVPTRAFSWLKA